MDEIAAIKEPRVDISPSGEAPEEHPAAELVGCRISISWPGDNEYYDARCIYYNVKEGLHKVLYFSEDSIEELSLSERKWKPVNENIPQLDPKGHYALLGQMIVLPTKTPETGSADCLACVHDVIIEDKTVLHRVVYIESDFVALIDLSEVQYKVINNATGEVIRVVNEHKGLVQLEVTQTADGTENESGCCLEEETLAEGHASPANKTDADKVVPATATTSMNGVKRTKEAAAGSSARPMVAEPDASQHSTKDVATGPSENVVETKSLNATTPETEDVPMDSAEARSIGTENEKALRKTAKDTPRENELPLKQDNATVVNGAGRHGARPVASRKRKGLRGISKRGREEDYAVSRLQKYIAIKTTARKNMRKAFVEKYSVQDKAHFIRFWDSVGGSMTVRLTKHNHRLLHKREIAILKNNSDKKGKSRDNVSPSVAGSSTRNLRSNRTSPAAVQSAALPGQNPVPGSPAIRAEGAQASMGDATVSDSKPGRSFTAEQTRGRRAKSALVIGKRVAKDTVKRPEEVHSAPKQKKVIRPLQEIRHETEKTQLEKLKVETMIARLDLEKRLVGHRNAESVHQRKANSAALAQLSNELVHLRK